MPATLDRASPFIRLQARAGRSMTDTALHVALPARGHTRTDTLEPPATMTPSHGLTGHAAPDAQGGQVSSQTNPYLDAPMHQHLLALLGQRAHASSVWCRLILPVSWQDGVWHDQGRWSVSPDPGWHPCLRRPVCKQHRQLRLAHQQPWGVPCTDLAK